MQLGFLQPYEQALREEPAGELAGIELVTEHGEVLELDVTRWMADVDAADRSVIRRCQEPTLDVGCGPGRLVRALYSAGIAALGVDIAAVAVALANERGGPALNLDVFGPLPAEGRWSTILLLDGNVGIGGDVCRLLARARDLLAPGGELVAEVSPWTVGVNSLVPLSVCFRRDGIEVGARFPWAVVDLAGLRAAARRVGLHELETWRAGGRIFLRLQR